jgi:putative ABC transport system substrate-binding protein
MNRRTFLFVTAGGLLAAPLAAAAQHGKVYRVGFFTGGARVADIMDGFYAGLRDRGYVVGRDLVVEERFPDVSPEQLLAVARELVALPVDVLVALGTVPAVAAKKATTTIPIVFASVPDPIVVGFVASLRQPGGNMTGVTFDAASETPAKRLQLLKEAVPSLSRVTVLHPHGDPLVGPQLETIKEAAPSLGIRLNVVSFQGADELEATFSTIRKQGAQGLLVIGGTMVWTNRQKIVDLALAHRLPSSLWSREMVAGGGLISLGPNYPVMLRQTAHFVDKILKGAKPADLPVEQPTRFELWINLKTAKALGLTIPPSLLQRADQVVE